MNSKAENKRHTCLSCRWCTQDRWYPDEFLCTLPDNDVGDIEDALAETECPKWEEDI